MLQYQQLAPSAPLTGLVECFWTLGGRLSAGDRTPHRILPDGSVEIVLNFADRFRRQQGRGREGQPAFMLVGQMQSPVVVEPGETVDLLGIRFLPAGAYPFLRVPLSELTGRMEPLDSLASWLTPELDRLYPLPMNERLVALQTLLVRRLQQFAPADGIVRAAAARVLASAGQIGLDELAALTGISGRQLERRFNTEVGLTPKVLARILRFQKVFHAAEVTGSNWADVALECGYYDQAHLVRDFREFAGEVPTRLFAEPDWLMQTFLRNQQMSDFSKTL